MSRRFPITLRFITLLFGLILLMTLLRIIFIFIEPELSHLSLNDFFQILKHGLPTDFSMAAYLMILPGITDILSFWLKFFRKGLIITAYFWLISFFLSAIYVVDAVLFSFWGTRLDFTPIFYFVTSPSSALASLTLMAEVGLIVLIAALTWIIYKWLNIWWNCVLRNYGKSCSVDVPVAIILTLSLFIPIRGGFSEATMTPGRGFFSSNNYVNQATVNPMFSFLYSVVHNEEQGEKFHFFESDEKARLVLDEFEKTNTIGDSASISLRVPTPDIYMIVLEGFSAHLMPILGGDAIAMGLDSLAINEGILFSNFYAESFRTDRALPAILSGYPAQPTISVIRFTSKIPNLPSLADKLKSAGWSTRYHYGGDSNFTNMKAYLYAMGFESISDISDYASSERISKWGAPDEYVFAKTLKDISSESSGKPIFSVIQTSSSHPPYDVPASLHPDEVVNSFMYADSCVVKFVDGLKAAGKWENALIIIVADHWGGYPASPDGLAARHHIPLIILGGALNGVPSIQDVVGSQADVAPTLLSLLGVDAKDFTFGHDLRDSNAPHYARVSEKDWFGLVDSDNELFAVPVEGNASLNDSGTNELYPKAFYQLLYSDLSRR